MTLLPPAPAEEQLSHVAQQFSQWRQSRTTPRGRIPQSLWAQAVALTHRLPLARVAKQLGLTPQVLKRRRGETGAVAVPSRPPRSPHFVEVTAAWRAPPRRSKSSGPTARGCESRIVNASPALAPLLQTFLETR